MGLILTKIDLQPNVHNYNRYKGNSHQLDEIELHSIFGKPNKLFIIASTAITCFGAHRKSMQEEIIEKKLDKFYNGTTYSD